MTIIQLEYFMAVVNHGSFSTAASYCFVTQPSLSMQIGNLEEELGVILLDRSRKPIVPTEAGKVVLEQARNAVAAFHATKEKVNDLRGDISGTLHLGVAPTITPYMMPLFVSEFTDMFPDVVLDIEDMYTADLIEALNRDTVDIAIMSGGSDMNLRETELFDDKLYVYASTRNELFGRDKVQVSDIDIKKVLLLSEGNCLRNQVLTLCKARKKIKMPYNFMNCSLETLMHTVDNTSMLTIIPGMAIEHIPENRHKQIIPFVPELNAHRKITMAVGRTYIKDALVRGVEQVVRSVAKRYDISKILHS